MTRVHRDLFWPIWVWGQVIFFTISTSSDYRDIDSGENVVFNKKKLILVLLIFFAVIPTCLLCQMKAKPPGVELREIILSSLFYILHEARNKGILTSKSCIWREKKKEKEKNVLHVHSCISLLV